MGKVLLSVRGVDDVNQSHRHELGHNLDTVSLREPVDKCMMRMYYGIIIANCGQVLGLLDGSSGQLCSLEIRGQPLDFIPAGHVANGCQRTS